MKLSRLVVLFGLVSAACATPNQRHAHINPESFIDVFAKQSRTVSELAANGKCEEAQMALENMTWTALDNNNQMQVRIDPENIDASFLSSLMEASQANLPFLSAQFDYVSACVHDAEPQTEQAGATYPTPRENMVREFYFHVAELAANEQCAKAADLMVSKKSDLNMGYTPTKAGKLSALSTQRLAVQSTRTFVGMCLDPKGKNFNQVLYRLIGLPRTTPGAANHAI